MRAPAGQKARPRAGDRGAVLVELALISTILVTLVLGVFEIGMAWSDHQEVTAASRSGARVGSQLGISAQADNQILLSVQAGLGSLAPQVAKIVIFEADANGNMPAACETAGAGYAGAAHCNVYGTTSLAALSTSNQWGSGAACGPLDGNWCSVTKRSNIQASATYLGVYVEINHKYLTGLFGGGTKKMTESTVMRLEPVQ